MTLIIGSNRIPGQDWIRIVKLVDYDTIVARPNTAFPNWCRRLTTSPASPARSPEFELSMPVRRV
jgi:hypothetical protein